MNGSEGGIPYHTPKRTKVVHAVKPGTFARPACGSTAGHYRTNTDPEKVTCGQCLHIPPKKCFWALGCDNPATGKVAIDGWGDISICDTCKESVT